MRGVQVFSQDGCLRVSFYINKVRRRWALGLRDDVSGRRIAQGIAERIRMDILTGHFVDDANHYRPGHANLVTPGQPARPLTTGELWERFTQYRRMQGTSESFVNNRFKSMAANIDRYGREVTDEATGRGLVDYLRSRQAPATANQNLCLLKGFGEWCVIHQHWPVNPFANILPTKGAIPTQQVSLTQDQVRSFLNTIKHDPVHGHYYDFCFCLFHLGCRPSELIGLRWRHLDLEKRRVTITESLSRGDDGRTSGAARKRKSTKTGGARTLPINEIIAGLFRHRYQGQAPDDLVFTAPKGGAIDDHSFSQRVWRRICDKAGIPRCTPYTARHTCLSHIVEETGSLAQAAAVAGHKSLRMVSDTYGHLVNDIKMPSFY